MATEPGTKLLKCIVPAHGMTLALLDVVNDDLNL